MYPTARFIRRFVSSLFQPGPATVPHPGIREAAAAAVESLERRTFLSVVGAVFVGTNHNNTQDPDEPGNEVVMYDREEDGSLVVAGRFDTGGQGSGPSIRFAGDGLGSAHSVQLSEDKKFLFVTNAGSDNVTTFRVSPLGLTRTDIEPTGDFPNSVTQHGNLVYVLNAAGQGSITGYRLSSSGNLTAIPNSTRTLGANQDFIRPDTLFNPAEVAFTPDGKRLVVTIKDGPAPGAIPGVTPTGPGRVLVYDVGNDGRPSNRNYRTDLGNRGPFGFSFDKKGNLLIAQFVGGPNLTASAGSFRINGKGFLHPISGNVPNGQLDSCWIENDGTYAWTANYTSGNISSYKISPSGKLTLLEAVAGTTEHGPNSQGSTPLDIRVTPNGGYLYNVLPGTGKVAGWKINKATGALTKVGEFGGLGMTVNGDVAPFEFGPGGSPAGIDAVDYSTPFNAPLNVLYVQSNDPRNGKNAILAYRRDPNTGALSRLGEFNTGGTGFFNNDDRIGPDDHDQEIVVSRDRRFLYTVNQGSNTVTAFRIAGDGKLTRIGVTDSGGKQPVSVGLAGDVLVVVNKGDQNPGGSGGTSVPNYTSFRVRDDGTIQKVRGSTVEANPGSSPTQALISRDKKFVFGESFLDHPIPELFPGSNAVVPAFGTVLETFKIERDGQLTPVEGSEQTSPLPSVPDQYILGLQTHPTARVVYTGFVVGNKLGVFTYDGKGKLSFVKAVSTMFDESEGGAGLCWITVSKDGKRLYGTNFSTNSVSVFNVEDPLNPILIQDVPLKNSGPPHPATPPSPALFNTVAFQIAIDPQGETVYVVDHEQSPDNSFPAGNSIHTLRVRPDGRLTEIANSPTLFSSQFVPAGAHVTGAVAV